MQIRVRTAAALNWLSLHPLLTLTLVLAAQVLPYFGVKDVWMPDEARHAAVFRNLWEGGHWLVLHLGDAAYADKPPVYFWLLAGLAWLTGSTGPALFMLAAAISAWVLLAVMVHAGWRLGLGPRTVLLAGLVLLTNWFFIERAHQPRMDLLFAAFILLAEAALFRATTGANPARLRLAPMLAAGLAMGAAMLTKGPLGVAMPLVALALYLIWQRRARSLASGGMAGCLAVVSGIGLIYLAGVIATEGWAFVRTVAVDQLWTRAVASVDLSEPVYAYLPMLAIALLPWTPVLIWALARKVRALGWAIFWPPVAQADNARGYIYACVIGPLAVISAMDYKIAFLLVPLLAPLALILATEVEALPDRDRRWLFASVAAVLALAAAVAPFAPALTLWPEHVKGAPLVAGGLAVTAGLAVWAHRASALRFAVVLALGVTLTLLPLYRITMQGLNAVMSPRALAEVVADHAAKGYAVAEYDPAYTGHFDYHAGVILTALRTPADLEAFGQKPCGLVVMRARLQTDWAAPPAVTIAAQVQLDAATYRVLVWGENCR